MITPPVVVWLYSAYGWRPAFWLTGALGVALGIVWLWLYRDPEAQPRLSQEEREYIYSGREPPLGTKPSIPGVL
jgi:MFS transporter, ACS family, hexuronate transporter